MHESKILPLGYTPAFTGEALKAAKRLPEDSFALLLGSNLSNPAKQLETAKNFISEAFKQKIIASPLYKSAAWGFKSDDFFLNQVLLVQGKMHPLQLLDLTQDLEKKMGRKEKSTFGYSSRIIDVDILFWGNSKFTHERLTIPHPQLHIRKFTMAPLCDLIPDYVHPILDLPLSVINSKLTDQIEKIGDKKP
ncbi:MAG: 2-amino-4-hydroxy-6-hydroxymethyldihydropteridine diphosphokinase [Luteibaculum sp.]